MESLIKLLLLFIVISFLINNARDGKSAYEQEIYSSNGFSNEQMHDFELHK